MCTRATTFMAISPEALDDDELDAETYSTEQIIKVLYDRLAHLKDERKGRNG